MGLTSGLDVARSSLAATSEQLSLVSRNIARIDDPNASRKTARIITGPGPGVSVGRIDRAYDAFLTEKVLSSNSDAVAQSEIYTSLDRLHATIGDTELDRSPASLLASLSSSLQQYQATPQNSALAGAVVSAATDLAQALNDASQTVATVRRQADADIATSVGKINSLLSQFSELNAQIVQGYRRGTDMTDALDARDGVMKQLSSEIGIRAVQRDEGDIALYTDSGVTLFDKIPRSVTFSATPLLAPGVAGNAVYADGVPIAGAQHVMEINSGRIAGLVAVRDEIAPAYENQLDEMARGLIEAFAEYDQSVAPTLPAAAGLFTYSGGPAIPPTGAAISGLAGIIKVNANVDPYQGGDPTLLRDGGISNPGNPAYTYNATGAASYTDRINELITGLDSPRSFDPSAQLGASESLMSFTKDSVSWLEGIRQSVKSEADYRATVSQRAQASLSKDTGISLDEEMTNMLSLERTFQASSRIISAIDDMLSSLIASVR